MGEELRRQVQGFGLTEKEADTYLTILDSGPTTVTEIANEADVSKRYVYTVAEKLEDRHFIIVNDYFTPTTIEAAPPEEVYDRLNEEVNGFYNNLKEKYRTGTSSGDTKVLKSRSTVINKIEAMVGNAEDQLALSLPALVIPALSDALRDAVERGVLVLLLVFEDRNPPGDDPLADVSLNGIAHTVRYRNSNLPILLSVDSGSALVSSRGVLTQPDSTANALFLGQQYMQTVVFSSLMNSLWVNSEEISVTSPHDLPHTYTNLRRVAIDATLYLNRGEDIAVECEARPTDHPESAENVVGEVSKVKQRIINPTTDPRPRQCCLCVRTDDGTVTIGNYDAFFEDYRAYKTTLRSAGAV
jgi:sugar-specific transcriptional regulator TrmB